MNIPEGATHRSEGFFYRKAGNSWQLFGGNHGWIESACEDSWLDANAEPLITKAQPCRTDGRCEHAIQSGAEANGHCPDGKCAMPQPSAHLAIPGALEWDGDNGTHSADGESRAHGESSELEQLRKKTAVTMGVGCGAGQLFVHGDSESISAAKAIVLEGERLRAELASTEQSRRSFFDLSQDLEKRLAPMKAFASEMIGAAFEGGSFDGGDIQDIAVKHGLLQIEQRTEECGEVCACREYGFPASCYRKTDLVKGGEQ